ncbi:hypothetical protein NPIL_153601 [Nephila pilipes]|uniref:Uncharacterized protein n=1 Tax=Nephila pilipes TaxID=299642 RepID=A0A8X6N9E9_NEPPI|nr:hypothetical protein NPIL_153601 [Nephila pilipes]
MVMKLGLKRFKLFYIGEVMLQEQGKENCPARHDEEVNDTNSPTEPALYRVAQGGSDHVFPKLAEPVFKTFGYSKPRSSMLDCD